MRRWMCLLGFSLLFASVASAQDPPKADLFVGYTYVHQTYDPTVGSFNLNGGMAQIAAYPVSWLGLVGEFGGYVPGAGASGGEISYLFGPRLAFRHGPLQPYVQGLIGGDHITSTLQAALGSNNANSFAMAIGGGVDLKAGKHFAIRLGQADYFLTRLQNPVPSTSAFNQNNFRFSTGLVFRF